MLYYDRIYLKEELILIKVMTVNNVLSATIGFLIMDLNIKNFACNGCHDWRMLCLHFKNIAIIMVKDVDYDCLALANMKQLIHL